ncbi:hypothetical protein [Micromonospora endolithica]|uniref:hypothetical protein n=1 Tax=Micromonospora endolithica TaxID=230091 RepID=UPI00164A639B|nr:hypothetical protein [Micromonospora endolithica]
MFLVMYPSPVGRSVRPQAPGMAGTRAKVQGTLYRVPASSLKTDPKGEAGHAVIETLGCCARQSSFSALPGSLGDFDETLLIERKVAFERRARTFQRLPSRESADLVMG